MLFDGLLIEHQCRPQAVAAAGTSGTIVYRNLFLSSLLGRPIQCLSLLTRQLYCYGFDSRIKRDLQNRGYHWNLNWHQDAVLSRYLPAAIPVQIPDTTDRIQTLLNPIPCSPNSGCPISRRDAGHCPANSAMRFGLRPYAKRFRNKPARLATPVPNSARLLGSGIGEVVGVVATNSVTGA
jgi:hypothetical protein